MNKFRNLALTIVTAIGVSNTIGYTYLNKNQINDNTVSNNETSESLVTSAVQEISDNSDISEKDDISEDTKKGNEQKAEITTENKTDDVKESNVTEALPNEDSTVTSESKGAENSTSDTLYSIRNIMSNLTYVSSTPRQWWTLDIGNDSVYYTNWHYILKVDLSSGESEIIAEDLNVSQLFYNSFTGDTFSVTLSSTVGSLISNLNNGKVYSKGFNYYQPIRFVDDNIFVGIDFYSNAISGIEWGIAEDSIVQNKSGYIGKYGEGVTDIQSIIYNDCYYWIITFDDNIHQLYYTLQSVKENIEDLSDPLEEFNAVACTVSNNEVYFMMSDFSVYKLNMEKVTENQNKPVTTAPEKIFYSEKSENTESDSIKKYCSLYLDGSKIKQTGKTNLNSVDSFYIRNNGDVVVFDTFDSTIKVIEKNQG